MQVTPVREDRLLARCLSSWDGNELEQTLFILARAFAALSARITKSATPRLGCLELVCQKSAPPASAADRPSSHSHIGADLMR